MHAWPPCCDGCGEGTAEPLGGGCGQLYGGVLYCCGDGWIIGDGGAGGPVRPVLFGAGAGAADAFK